MAAQTSNFPADQTATAPTGAEPGRSKYEKRVKQREVATAAQVSRMNVKQKSHQIFEKAKLEKESRAYGRKIPIALACKSTNMQLKTPPVSIIKTKPASKTPHSHYKKSAQPKLTSSMPPRAAAPFPSSTNSMAWSAVVSQTTSAPRSLNSMAWSAVALQKQRKCPPPKLVTNNDSALQLSSSSLSKVFLHESKDLDLNPDIKRVLEMIFSKHTPFTGVRNEGRKSVSTFANLGNTVLYKNV